MTKNGDIMKGQINSGWEGEVKIGPDLKTMRESKGLIWLEVDLNVNPNNDKAKGYLQIHYPSGVEERLENLEGVYVIGLYPGDDREIRVIAEYIGRGMGMKHDDITTEIPTFRLTTHPTDKQR